MPETIVCMICLQNNSSRDKEEPLFVGIDSLLMCQNRSNVAEISKDYDR